MREAFDLVRGAVSKKDLIPVLTHFAIHEGRVHGFNGRVHISAPALDARALPSFTVPALLMTAAVDACRGEPQFEVRDSQVHIKDSASSFRATLPTGPIDSFPLPT